jgi:hypothetical protein
MLGYASSVAMKPPFALLLGPALALACSGRVAGKSAGTCVDVVASDYDTSCRSDSDCITITAGHLCSGQCACGGTTVNVDGEARYQAALSSLQLGECNCPLQIAPRCVANVCTLCEPGGPATCADGG